MTRRILAAAALVAAVLAPAAAAHGGGGGKLGYHSTVVRLTPRRPRVHVQVVDSDDRLQLQRDGERPSSWTATRKSPTSASTRPASTATCRSPATYLNDDRFGNVKLPANADPKAAPPGQRSRPPDASTNGTTTASIG